MSANKLITLEFPDSVKIKTLSQKELPSDWKEKPHPNSTQLIGDKFAEANKYLVLKVPSAVTPNYTLFCHREGALFVIEVISRHHWQVGREDCFALYQALL